MQQKSLRFDYQVQVFIFCCYHSCWWIWTAWLIVCALNAFFQLIITLDLWICIEYWIHKSHWLLSASVSLSFWNANIRNIQCISMKTLAKCYHLLMKIKHTHIYIASYQYFFAKQLKLNTSFGHNKRTMASFCELRYEVDIFSISVNNTIREEFYLTLTWF